MATNLLTPAFREPPRPPDSLPLIGDIRRFGPEKNMLFHFIDAWEQFGDLCQLRLGPYRVHVIAKPDYVHHVMVKNAANYIKGNGYTGFRLLVGNGLVTSDGELWRRQRGLMQPSFTPRSVAHFAGMMTESMDQMLDRWHTVAQSRGELCMDEEMARLTMSIISKTIFGVDLAAEDGASGSSQVSEAFHRAFAFVTARTMSAMPLPLPLPLPAHRQFKRDRAIIDAFVRSQIEKGRQAGEVAPDQETIISILLRARDAESGAGMSETQIRDEAVTLFLAGFETTARTLTWGWYLLDRHRAALARMTDEAGAVLTLGLSPLAVAEQLVYTRAVVDEALRLFPPTALLARQVVEDDVIDGYRIPGGSIVMLLPFITHRYPGVWDAAEAFRPERWLPDPVTGTVAERPKSAYVPFANGPRICLGNHFALLEMTLTFAKVAQRFHLWRQAQDPIGYEFHGSTAPTAPLIMQIQPR